MSPGMFVAGGSGTTVIEDRAIGTPPDGNKGILQIVLATFRKSRLREEYRNRWESCG